MIFFDTETCGLHGPIVLLQYLQGPLSEKTYLSNDKNIVLYCPWKETIGRTIDLLESFTRDPEGVMAFNIVFDWFHVCQMLTTLYLMDDRSKILIDCKLEYYNKEPLARDGPCIKPRGAFDVMLHARKGPYQSTMGRRPIKVRKVPTPLAAELAKELENRISLSDIYFTRKKASKKWTIKDLDDPAFKDLELKFSASSALKALAIDALGISKERVHTYSSIEADQLSYPDEVGWGPYGLGAEHAAASQLLKGQKKPKYATTWRYFIDTFVSYWTNNSLAREYAADDVKYVRDLYWHFGSPPINDTDSILGCMVAAIRWRGFAVNIQALEELKQKALKKQYLYQSDGTPILDTWGDQARVPTAPAAVKKYLSQVLSPTEMLGLASTKKAVLEKFKDDPLWEDQPVRLRAAEVLEARQMKKEVELYNKLITAGRLHADFKIIGTRSSRLAGDSDLNAQAIKKQPDVRGAFILAWPHQILVGGDFAGFEVTLAEACYNDPGLRQSLLTCELCEGQMAFDPVKEDIICTACGSKKGKKIHALFGVFLYPGSTYQEIKATDGKAGDMYDISKKCVFSVMYGAEAYTLENRYKIPLEIADAAVAKFSYQYPGVGRFRRKIFEDFCSLRQPGGLGSQVTWTQPKDSVKSLFGFERFFTLENQIRKALYDLANNPPKTWRHIQIHVMRRDRMQLASGAVQSALYGSAFGIQGQIMRAANNHVIQSSGAQITKEVQGAIWELQPAGIHDWVVMPLNIHDEILCPCDPTIEPQLTRIVKNKVESYREKVPLIKIDWENLIVGRTRVDNYQKGFEWTRRAMRRLVNVLKTGSTTIGHSKESLIPTSSVGCSLIYQRRMLNN